MFPKGRCSPILPYSKLALNRFFTRGQYRDGAALLSSVSQRNSIGIAYAAFVDAEGGNGFDLRACDSYKFETIPAALAAYGGSNLSSP